MGNQIAVWLSMTSMPVALVPRIVVVDGPDIHGLSTSCCLQNVCHNSTRECEVVSPGPRQRSVLSSSSVSSSREEAPLRRLNANACLSDGRRQICDDRHSQRVDCLRDVYFRLCRPTHGSWYALRRNTID